MHQVQPAGGCYGGRRVWWQWNRGEHGTVAGKENVGSQAGWCPSWAPDQRLSWLLLGAPTLAFAIFISCCPSPEPLGWGAEQEQEAGTAGPLGQLQGAPLTSQPCPWAEVPWPGEGSVSLPCHRAELSCPESETQPRGARVTPSPRCASRQLPPMLRPPGKALRPQPQCGTCTRWAQERRVPVRASTSRWSTLDDRCIESRVAALWLSPQIARTPALLRLREEGALPHCWRQRRPGQPVWKRTRTFLRKLEMIARHWTQQRLSWEYSLGPQTFTVETAPALLCSLQPESGSTQMLQKRRLQKETAVHSHSGIRYSH